MTKPEDLDPTDFCSQSPRFQGENFYKNLQLVEQVKAIASEKSATPSQLALAWLLAQGQDIVPISGTKRRKYLEENAAGADITLTPEDLQRIEVVALKGIAVEERYAPRQMSSVNL